MLIALSPLQFATAYDLSEYPSPFIKDGKFDGVLVVGDTAPAEDVVALSDIIASLQFLVLDQLGNEGVAVDSLDEKQTKTYNIDNLYYEITLNFIDANRAQFIVNGMTTTLLLPGEFERLPGNHVLTLAGIKSENDIYYAVLSISKEKIDSDKLLLEVGTAKLASEVENIRNVNSILVGHACDNSLVAEVSGRLNCKDRYEKGKGVIESYEMPNGKVSLVVTGDSKEDISRAARVLSSYEDYKASFNGIRIEVFDANNKNILPERPLETYSPKNTNTDFSEVQFKIGILLFLVLLFVLLALVFRKKPKTNKGA